MNQNRPFFSTNTNCYDESFTSSAPTQVNGENVILSQEQQRRVCDTLNTSIVGNPNIFSEPGNNMNQILYAQKQYYPGGVLFTFPSAPTTSFGQQQGQSFGPGLCYPCPPVSYPTPIQTAPISTPMDFSFQQPAFQQPMQCVNTFFPSSLEYQQMNQNALQQPYQYHREPYQLKFHNDRSTSCSDMLKGETQIPSSNFTNINGVIQRLQQDLATLNTCKDLPCTCPIEFSSNVKKLVLSKPVKQPSGHVIDVLDDKQNGKKDNKPRVSFSDKPVDEGAQVDNECFCIDQKDRSNSKIVESGDESSADKPKKRKQKKKKPKKQVKSSSETSVSSAEDTKDQKKTSKNSRWGKHGKSDTTESDSSDSEKAHTKSKKKGKTRKQKIKGKSKNTKEDKTQTDSSEFMNGTSEEMDYSTDAEHCKCD
ncbi:uncharacterized protein LOC126742294 isoform X2 [Anthonomus grandis grandis]|uniref:uncharacterized protein LOC126742294 isoform X2 n=1 Tax=Anthonomus grandis grandis TaxID=2921223 RepID=UPI0021666E87|nr:uncharacterized protein LOC126742294 isoform X2 [Anthonomus grandis grandis]